MIKEIILEIIIGAITLGLLRMIIYMIERKEKK